MLETIGDRIQNRSVSPAQRAVIGDVSPPGRSPLGLDLAAFLPVLPEKLFRAGFSPFSCTLCVSVSVMLCAGERTQTPAGLCN